MNQQLAEIPLNLIATGVNYRQTFRDKSLRELAASIRENGVLEPVIVRCAGDGSYELISGERRLRAAVMARLVTIPAVVRDVQDSEVLRLQLVENTQREGVPFMEEAAAINRLRTELALDVAEICEMIGKSQSYVYHMIRLMQMPAEAREICAAGKISKAVAFRIGTINEPDLQVQAATDLARKPGRHIPETSAKRYIQGLLGDGRVNLRKAVATPTVKNGKPARKDDFAANWKYFLVRFSAEQFESFKAIVRGRTDTATLSEAVEQVMLDGDREIR